MILKVVSHMKDINKLLTTQDDLVAASAIETFLRLRVIVKTPEVSEIAKEVHGEVAKVRKIAKRPFTLATLSLMRPSFRRPISVSHRPLPVAKVQHNKRSSYLHRLPRLFRLIFSTRIELPLAEVVEFQTPLLAVQREATPTNLLYSVLILVIMILIVISIITHSSRTTTHPTTTALLDRQQGFPVLRPEVTIMFLLLPHHIAIQVDQQRPLVVDMLWPVTTSTRDTTTVLNGEVISKAKLLSTTKSRNNQIRTTVASTEVTLSSVPSGSVMTTKAVRSQIHLRRSSINKASNRTTVTVMIRTPGRRV